MSTWTPGGGQRVENSQKTAVSAEATRATPVSSTASRNAFGPPALILFGGAGITERESEVAGNYDGAGSARGLKREEVRAAVERALEAWLFGPAGQPEHRSCPSCGEGRLGLRFVGCGRYPACRYTRPLARDPADDGAGPVPLGTDPGTGLALTLRTGRYGRYVQRGEVGKDPAAARGTVPMGMEADEITPEVARALLALPRTVGTHPETGKEILAGIGRYGPWLKHGAAYVVLPEDEDVLTVGLNRAVALVDTG